MTHLNKLIRAVEEEFGQTKTWAPLIAQAKKDLQVLEAMARKS